MAYLFVIVTSDKCPHCITFKEQHLNKLLDNLKNFINVNILHVALPESSTQGYFTDPKKKFVFKFLKGPVLPINNKLENLIGGFPQFFLFQTAIWSAINADLKGWSLNGNIVNGKTVPLDRSSPEIVSRTASGITEWIRNIIVTNGSTSISGSPGSSGSTSSINFNNKNEEYLPKYLEPSKIKIRIGPRNED